MNTYEYEVTVTGTLIATIQANSLDDAKAEVREQGGPGLFDDEYGIRRFCPQIEIVRWKDVGLSYDVEWTEK